MRDSLVSFVSDLKPTSPGLEAPSGGGAIETDVDSKGLKRTAHNISFAFNMIRTFGANELQGVKPFVM
ncbi:MAG: hypothetical protein DMG24_18545 [Acidobacteria bacterium]|nr:MAG: hypothetical protein DMG24_18545 [Acidobacteriota bacterium]